MSTSKKYYYLKLKDSYFDQDNIKILESQNNGYIYSLIILKLYLKSIKHEGKLMMTSSIPYDPVNIDTLAKVLNHDIAHVKEAIKLSIELELITILNTKEIWMTDIQNFIGESSTEADRIREYRKKIGSVQMYDKRTPEIEIEIEKESIVPYKEIIKSLNEICGTKYLSTTKKTRSLISARIKEGFVLDDFITVINKKYKEWGQNSDMVKFLRPETLFGNKFEGYLNQKILSTSAKESYRSLNIKKFEPLEVV